MTTRPPDGPPDDSTPGSRLATLYDRFARSFDAPPWSDLPEAARHALCAALAQLPVEERAAERVFTPADVAERLQVSPDVVYSKLRTGALAGLRIGTPPVNGKDRRPWRIPSDELERFVQNEVERAKALVAQRRTRNR